MITAQECKERHKNLWRVLSAILVILTVIVTGVGWSIDAGYSAKNAAQETRHSLRVHEATQNGKLERVEIDVREIKTEQKEQRKMIEDIWKRGS
jgi:hypothetical protein